MKKPFRCLPVGSLPYDTDKAATKLTVKLFESMPFLANLPNASEDDSIIKRTLMNTPGLVNLRRKILNCSGLMFIFSKNITRLLKGLNRQKRLLIFWGLLARLRCL